MAQPSTSHHAPMEFIFLGTGTSSSIPHVDCLTRPPYDPNDSTSKPPCRTCLSTLTPEGKKNIRRNTSALVRTKAQDGRDVTIVIDAGKTFQAAAVEWFPKHGLRNIDALLITHAHADAMNGLDDLRGWTLGNSIQPHIDVYVSQATFTEVQRSFPYLVSKEYASGGGDVPDFVWHIIDDKVPFEINDTGIWVTPFSVHHGRIFSTIPPPAYLPTPSGMTGGTVTPALHSEPLEQALRLLSVNGTDPQKNAKEPVIQPYLCFGFKIQDEIVYLSDVSHIPEEAWSIIHGAKQRREGRPLPLCILDCLGLRSHTSHFGLEQSVAVAREISATRTYLLGFSHIVSHQEYVTITEAVGGAKVVDENTLTENEQKGLDLIGSGEPFWIRPAHDGLRVVIDNGLLRDDTYSFREPISL
ncbi:MAG: beta-lactamase-like protein [Lentinula lateritia]|uniref:Beta-lactamase-like protein n=1 Tax=Lentinula lateritia TaxID=40482 RepID=A0ABQ8VS06_9AGAR|nr:MAG: beta-lactamase-like protein [Lentinula lateritia]KAJ4499096.1 beta-lactamase-like protein [Lentinula lateritia]